MLEGIFELEKLSYNERLSKIEEIRVAIDIERRNTIRNLEKQKTEAEKKKSNRLNMLIFILLFSVGYSIFFIIFMVELFFISYILLTLIFVLMIWVYKYDKSLKPQLIQRYNQNK